jgi:outer membrane protein
MKAPIAALLLGLALCAAAAPAPPQPKIALVDLKKLFENYYKKQVADTKLRDQNLDLQKEEKALLDQYQKAIDEHKKLLDEANNQAISSDEREKRKRSAENKLIEIKELEQTITQFKRTAYSNLEEQTRRMRDNLVGEIRNVVNAQAKLAGYWLVIDTSAETFNQTPIVLYTSGENDITDTVLAQLNATAPPGAVTPGGNGKKGDKK